MVLSPRPPGHRRKGRAENGADQEVASVRHGYIKSADGTKLFYSVEGQGKPLVFCYGLVCSSLHWTYQISHFNRSHQAVWMDYRGHNHSDIPKDLDSLTVETLAGDLLQLLDELQIEDAVFLGHSMGVNTVLEAYRQQPKRVAAMVLANGTPKRPLETLFSSNFLAPVFGLGKLVQEKAPDLLKTIWSLQKGNPFTRAMIQLGGFNPHLTPPDDVKLYVDQVASLDPAVFLKLISNYDHYDATPWLHQVKVPTLVIAGERDRVIPLAQQELMHQLIPGSKLEVIRHGSHCPQMDLPDLVNMKIEKFLQDIKYDSVTTRSKGSASRSTARRPSPASSEAE